MRQLDLYLLNLSQTGRRAAKEMLVLRIKEHVKILYVLHLGLDLEDLGKWRDHLYGYDHSSLFIKEALNDLTQTVTSTILGRDALDVDSSGFKPLMVFVLRHFRMILSVSSLSLPAS
jgi:hypothetical protein